jgi:hypothetical protein
MSKPYTKRSRSGIRFQWLNWDQTNPSGSFANSVATWEDKADGESNPDWKSQIAANEGATTNFLGSRTTCTHVDGYLEFRGYVTALGDTPASFRMSGKRGALQAPDYSTSVPAGSSSVNAAVSQADSKFYNEASGIIKALEGGELLGETHKTATAIIRKSTEVAGLLLNWRKNWNKFRSSHRGGNREASLKRAMSFASDNYLEWKFGVDPLVKDTQALAHDLRDDFKQVETFEARGKGSEMGPTLSSIPFGPLGGLVSASANTVSIQTCSIQYKAAIVLRRYGVGGLAERLGLSPSNFLPTYYNLLPWSWLIDYFTNCGDIVSAIAFDPARIAWCNRSVRRTLTTTTLAGVNPVVNAGLTPHAGYPIASPSRTEWVSKIVSRSSSMPSRIPELRFRTPDFQTEGGRTRWTNIAAVITSQAFGHSILGSLGGGRVQE